MRRIATLTLVLAVWPLFAAAESVNTSTPTLTYGVKTLSFDRWCQDDQRYPESRCDARLPGDVMAFEDYRARVERYDLQYEKDRTKEHEFERDMFKHDHSQPQPTPDVIAPSPQ
jgi:hypothetical protein